MNVGQRVMLIGPLSAYRIKQPPIGAIGEITEPIDRDGDYFVLFPEYPCPVGEPDWYVHHSVLIPIDDGESVAPRAKTVCV